jgi:phosphoribosylformylglycinamidine synthase
MRARVLVRPKAGILDPQGQAVERALPALGFEGVSNVHVGRLIELDVEDPSRLPEMCERLLANPLIEDYEIVEGARSATGQAEPEAEQDSQTAGLEAPRRTTR